MTTFSLETVPSLPPLGDLPPGRSTIAEVGEFLASDSYALRFRRWRPQGETAGVVVALHGIQSHGGWYDFSCGRLAEAGYDVWFLDRRGSGLNTIARGDAPHAERLINDVVQFLNFVRFEVRADELKLPIVLEGISWGGKIAAIVAARRPELLDGLALLYPGIHARVRPRRFIKMLMKFAVSVGWGDFRVRIPLDDPALFSAHEKGKNYIQQDPLSLHDATLKLLQASCDLDLEAVQTPAHIPHPLLVQIGELDRIIDVAATRRFVERFPEGQGTFIMYPGASHTLEFEPNREEIVDDFLRWMAELPPRG